MTSPAPSEPLWKCLLPSSLGSLGVHIVVLLLAGWSLRGCERGVPAEAGGEKFRDIGLTVINDSSAAVSDQPAQETQDTDVLQPPSEAEPQDVVPQVAPSVADLLGKTDAASDNLAAEMLISESPAVIGPGAPLAGLQSPEGGVPDLIQPSGTTGRGAAGSPTPGPGETSFMTIADSGRTFVYVIDVSGSMGQEGRLRMAQAQLKASLQQLQPSQRFQVIFYDESVRPIKLRRRPLQDWYPATTVLVDLAAAAIDQQIAGPGTEHMPALLAALRLEPEVVYFLTDGREPPLVPAELKEVQRANGSGAHIHVIEFALGPPESRDVSWLQRLASQSGGKYVRLGG